jgi:hypothetical protein
LNVSVLAVELSVLTLLLVLLVAAILGLPILIGLIVLVVWVGGKISRRASERRRAGAPTLQIPYYVDEAGLQSLAEGLKIELPVARTKDRTFDLSATWQGLGGKGSRSQSAQIATAIDLNRLVSEIRSRLTDSQLASALAFAPYVRDEDILADAATQIERSLGETSATREILKQLQQTYEAEKVHALAQEKRRELAATAEREKLIVLEGRFTPEPGAPGESVGRIRLTALQAVPHVRIRTYVTEHDGPLAFEEMQRAKYLAEQASELERASEIPMPDGAAITVAFANGQAMTASGTERLQRQQPFYGRVIAHSPTFDESSGELACSAYAVWSVPTDQD